MLNEIEEIDTGSNTWLQLRTHFFKNLLVVLRHFAVALLCIGICYDHVNILKG